MNHVTDIALGLAALATAAGLVLYPPHPRPKPEPPVQTESRQEEVAPGRVEAEPLPPRTEEQRKVDQAARDVRQIERDIKEIKAAIRIQQAAKAASELPQE